ncbi:TRAP transporter substrate-binding protein [Paracraurococcus lichenis]|uniref:TRAP transporter substrate-binding protein n=1 Tax=Paracraurococcus lichenis TaxID=3064888 RepID=A0ABT9DV44_9PROT|nr:TRAP transporter substrate-binding protein [Paracraurococcus sp. LOR1-02]MDO9707762.1 TRAP transporter substrate-binding protein [Paracraurococcus sp. LOR1-02]
MHRLMTLALAALLALATRAEAQTKWVMATPYPEGNYHTQTIRFFLAEVEKAAPGKLQVQLHTNGSLLPQLQIKRAVQTGQVQLGEILLGAYGNEDPVFEVDFIPFLASTYPQARALQAASEPALRARLEKQGVTPLYFVPWPSQALYGKGEIRSLEDLKGARFRAQTPIIARMAELLGATPVLVQAADVPQAFATGIVNAMLTSAQTGADSAAWDFSKYVYDIGFTLTRNAVLVNTRAFMALDEATRAAMRDAAAKAMEQGWAEAKASEAVQMEKLRSHGMQVGEPTPELLAGLRAIGAKQEEEWATKAGPDGRALLEKYRALLK